MWQPAASMLAGLRHLASGWGERLRPRTLVARILLGNTVVSLAVLAVALILSFARDVRDEQQEVAGTVDALVEMALPTLASSVVIGDYDTIDRTLKQITRHSLIREASYSESDGTVVAQGDGLRVRLPHPSWLTRLLDDGNPHRERAVTVGGRTYGVLRLEVDHERIAGMLWERLLDSVALAVALLAAGLGGGAVMMRRWLSKLQSIGTLESRIAAGETDATIVDLSADTPLEIRQAIEHVNRSASNLRQHFGGRIEALMAALVQHKAALDAAAIVCEVTPDGRLSYVNDLCCEAYMRPRDALLGQPLPGESTGPQPVDQPVPDNVTRARVVVKRAIDRPLWVQRTIVPIHDVTGALQKYICIDIDVTAMTELQRRLRQLSLAVETTSSAIFITDLQGRIEYVNPAFTHLTGFAPDQVIGQPITRLLDSGTPGEVLDALWATLQDGQCWRGRLRIRQHRGAGFWSHQVISVIRDEDGAAVQYVSVFDDISQLVAHQAAMHRLANHDTLTGLPNRRRFMEQARGQIDLGRRTGTPFAAMFLDLDGFKAVNDRYGHEAGDALLVEVSARIQAALRANDFVGRLGGDEFAMILVEPPDAAALAEIARRLIDSLERPVRYLGNDLRVSASIGVALYPTSGDTLETLLHHADLAMYTAKQRGKRQCCFYGADLAAQERHQVRLGEDLQHAVARGQLAVDYQPTVAAAGRQVLGAQALLRWNHAREGRLAAEQFWPVVGNTHQGAAIGNWFIDEVCRQISAWDRAGVAAGDIAVGLTDQQFADPQLPARIGASLARHGVAPRRLVVELHERMLTGPRGMGHDALAGLAAVGVQVLLAGFGLGDGSLQLLRQHRVDLVRLDRSLIAGLPARADDGRVVEGLLQLTRTLGIDAVADGVQSEAQAAVLAGWHCTRLQGGHIGPPLDAGALARVLADQADRRAPPKGAPEQPAP